MKRDPAKQTSEQCFVKRGPHAKIQLLLSTLKMAKNSSGSSCPQPFNCMHLKLKESKRFSSSLMTDVVITFRMTAKLFFFGKKVRNRWIVIQNGTTKLDLFPDLISASLLGATGLLFVIAV